MYQLIKSILFLLPAEQAHHFTTNFLKTILKIPGMKFIVRNRYKVRHPVLHRTLFGLDFPNPVGLAAGFDKNAQFIHEFASLGFGFIEIGTITPIAQPGNPKPRLFRLIKDEAIINRMGFNNDGMEIAAERLKRRPKNLIVGGNIGKNKVTPNEDAKKDYLRSFEHLHPYVDYFVVNVSSPNTPDLRQLQDKGPLTEIITALKRKNLDFTHPKPILLKIAPDLTNSQLDDILDMARETNLSGLIATNTTISRDHLTASSSKLQKIGEGGLSGKPVSDRSTEVIRYIRSKNKKIPIIGVGGIRDEKTALEKFNAGADLIQIYTGFIFEGPDLVRRINRSLIGHFKEA